MSFLSILVVASALYFAHARPDSQSFSEAFSSAQAKHEDGDGHDAPAVPEQSSISITDPKDYQHELSGLMQDLSKAVDQYLTPLMTNLDLVEQDELKSMGVNGFASYINYLLLLIQDQEYGKHKGLESSLQKGEMFIELQSYEPLDQNIPFVAYSQDEQE